MIYQCGLFRNLRCDECGFDQDDIFARNEFHEMIESAKSEGWQVKMDSAGEWKHTCPDCREDNTEGRLARQRALFGR